ncbi:MAG TPA: cytochrome P450 [Pseudonocardia sp.]|nr:cytochrome P450 [Pseudonocardia sp.]
MDRFFEAATISCPYPFYAELHEHDPVHRLEDEDGDHPVYLVTRYEDCLDVLSRSEVFSNKAGPGLRQKELMGPGRSGAAAGAGSSYRVVRTLLTNDAPSHTRFRKLVAKAFSARRINALEPAIRAVAHDLVDGFADSGEIDFVTDFAQPLPLVVIADFLGVPRRDLKQFRRWSDDAAEVLGGQLTPERSRECHESLGELLRYFAEQVELRRREPAEDFLTSLVDARIDDETPLSTEEMLSLAYVTLVAGNETTANMLASMMLLLLRNADQLARVRADRSLIPAAVEEALRLEAPVQGSVRVTREDTEVNGCPVPAGSRVLIVAGAANRDARVYDEPDRFDVDRADPRSHLTFGKGIHFCLGAALSRLEGAVALEVLLDRLNSVGIVEPFEPAYVDNAVLRGLRKLPLRVVRS